AADGERQQLRLAALYEKSGQITTFLGDRHLEQSGRGDRPSAASTPCWRSTSTTTAPRRPIARPSAPSRRARKQARPGVERQPLARSPESLCHDVTLRAVPRPNSAGTAK